MKGSSESAAPKPSVIGDKQCAHVYTEIDSAVRSGSKKVGDRCNSRRTKTEWNGYCFVHARKHGLIPSDELDEIDKKRANKFKLKRNAKVTDIRDKVKGPYKRIADFLPRCDDVSEVLAAMQILPGKGDDEYANEKMAFVLWSLQSEVVAGDVGVGSMRELSNVLNVPLRTLYSWNRESWFTEAIIQHNVSWFIKLLPLFLAAIADKIVNSGDVGAFKSAISVIREFSSDMVSGKDADGNKFSKTAEALDNLYAYRRDAENKNKESGKKSSVVEATPVSNIGNVDLDSGGVHAIDFGDDVPERPVDDKVNTSGDGFIHVINENMRSRLAEIGANMSGGINA